MPYDPDQPQNGQLIDADKLREQFAGLKALIDAAGGVAGAVVDGVAAVPDGDPPMASVTLAGNTLHFVFGLQRGAPGPEGPQGLPFANALIDAVNTLSAGSMASVSVSFDGSNVRFTFGIPQGFDGATGPQGLPGEVTQTDLNNATASTLGQTSSNSNAVSTLGFGADGAYNSAQFQAVVDKLDELINALRR